MNLKQELEEREQPPPKLVKEIFPLEIWSEIFKYLHSAEDLLSVFHTSQVWKELLKPNKVFPIIFPHLSSKDVLNCRFINHQWNEVVDNFFKFHPAHYDIGITTCTPKYPAHPLFKGFTIQELTQLLDTSTTNPFALTRYLSYHENMNFCTNFVTQKELKILSAQRQTLMSLVEKFGSEIWHFDLSLTKFGRDQYKVISGCLRHLPNLKTASISAATGKEFVAETGPTAPTLSGLVKLSLNVNGILNYNGIAFNSSLKQLQTQGLRPNMEMSKLEYLHTHLYSMFDVNNLGTLKAPLKVLKLEANFCYAAVRLESIFVPLTHFDDTLRELYLEYYVRNGEETNLELGLQLPSLLKLELHVGNHRLESVDFLSPCVALENLSVVSCGSFSDNYRARRAQPEIQFMGIESSMYNSNIWERLPNLQVFEVKDRTETFEYNRKDWEAKQLI